jgi:hypothetical protein
VAVVRGKAKPRWRRARGTARWSFDAKLRRGSAKLLVRAVDRSGNVGRVRSKKLR